MNAETADVFTQPKNVIYVDTMYVTFRYLTAMSVGDVAEIKKTFEIIFNGERYFKFLLKKLTEQSVSVICESHVKDETLKADSTTEADTLEADDGCFLRLYISVIGVNEGPKSTVLRSTDTSASVEFTEDSFLNPVVDVGNIYTLKCVVRRVETTILPNEKQELMWQEFMDKECRTDKQRLDMAYILKRPNLKEVLTGRTTDVSCKEKYDIFSRACYYSEELVQYFSAKENSKPVPPTFELGLILGYLSCGKVTTNPLSVYLNLYWNSVIDGMVFVKELCTAYVTENMDDESVIDVLFKADMTEDARLFQAAWLFCLKNKLQIFQTDEWKKYSVYKLDNCRSIVHNFLFRCFIGSQGFPPAMEDETAQP